MHNINLLDLNDLRPASGRDLTVPAIFGYTAESWTDALGNLGPVVQLHDQGQHFVAISSAAANQLAWRNPDHWSYQDTDFSTIFRTQLGEDHVTILDGEPHRRLRKLILPAFGAAALRRDITTTQASFADGLAAIAGTNVDLYSQACLLMARALNQTQIKNQVTPPLLTSLCQFEDEFIAGLQLTPEQQSNWFARPAYQQARSTAFAYFHQILEGRRQGAKQDDSLDIILQSASKKQFADLTTSELIESIYLLSIAGVGNIANFLCAMLWKVAGTRWQHAVQQELAEINLASIEGMKHLPVLKAIINETERLYPPAPVVPKRTTCDLEFLGHHLPQGTLVLHLHTLSHYDSEQYDAPFEFNPQRWLDGTPAKTNAFGGGKHLCLGMGVTRAFLPLLSGLLLRDYNLELTQPPHNKVLDESFGPLPVSTAMPVTLTRQTD